jgi:hypothetical protein
VIQLYLVQLENSNIVTFSYQEIHFFENLSDSIVNLNEDAS